MHDILSCVSEKKRRTNKDFMMKGKGLFMKNSRKLMSILLIVAMLFTLVSPAMAAMEGELTGGSITINDAVSGQTYNAYQILYLESYNADAKAYAYKANSEWEAWLKEQTAYVAFDEQGYVTWVEGADVAEFAKKAQMKAATLTEADATQTVAKADPVTSDNVVTFSGLTLGYYLVDTTLGTLCALDTTNPNVVMEEKNEVPEVTKDVQEDSDGSWGKTNDADINQTVDYKATITVRAGAENYILHDTMSAGLTYTGVTSVTIGDVNVPADKYTVTAPGTCEKKCTFEVAFDNDYIATLAAGTQIVVSYSATLNEDAVVGLDGNLNTVKLQYSDSTEPTYTPEDTTTTYTWDMDILKYANGDESKVLKDAKFVLLNSDISKVATIVDGKLTGWVDIPAAGEDGSITWPANTELTTNDNGKVEIDGLDADTYYLREIKAPDGYNKLASDVTVKITGRTTNNGEVTYSTYVAKVNNQSGAELPSTGGIGTTIFYVLGGALVIGAGVLLVTKRRMGAE